MKMRKRQYFLFIPIAVLMLLQLSSCYVTKEYQRPQINTQNLYRTDEITEDVPLSSDTTSMADISWKDFFTDQLLQGYIETALTNNIDIRVAIQSIDAAAAFLEQGKAAFLPSVTGSLDYSHSENSKNGLAGKQGNTSLNQYQLSVGASWEADIWGKIRSQERALLASYLQTIEAHKAVKTRLVANVASIYYQLIALSEQKTIAERTIQSRDSSLTATKALKSAGMVTEVAVQQTEAQLYDAQLILINLKQQERVLENTFHLLLNTPAGPVERNTFADQPVSTPLKIGVPLQLLANRPDVRQAELELINAFELTNVARSNFYPTLTITAGAGLQSIDIRNWLSLNSVFANIAGGLLQPIFARRQIRTAFEVAETRQEQAFLLYEYNILSAANEVSNALYDYKAQSERIGLQTRQLEAYSLAVDYSEQLLISGLANYLEVLTARQSALAAELNIVNTRYARLNAIIDLYQALGGGWK